MKINWNIIKCTFLLLLLGFLFAFSSKRNEHRNLNSKEVIFVEDDNHFITTSMVNKLLIQNVDDVTSIAKEILDLNEMESRLNNNPMISKAEVFVTIDGVLKARVKQRKPIARVADNPHFYIDSDGKKMPLSDFYSARVPMITGKSLEHYDKLYPLLVKLNTDTFMKQHIIGIHIEANENLTLYMRNYDFDINFGRPKNIETKIQNFKAFYQKTVNDSTIYKYRHINLNIDSQVVATKK